MEIYARVGRKLAITRNNSAQSNRKRIKIKIKINAIRQRSLGEVIKRAKNFSLVQSMVLYTF